MEGSYIFMEWSSNLIGESRDISQSKELKVKFSSWKRKDKQSIQTSCVIRPIHMNVENPQPDDTFKEEVKWNVLNIRNISIFTDPWVGTFYR